MRIAINQCDGALPAPQRLAQLEDCLGRVRGTVDVMVCPELFASGYRIGVDEVHARAQSADGPFNTAAAELARRFGIALVYGYPERDGERVFNSACCIDRGGRMIANHRKLYLSGDYEEAAFATGSRYTVFDLDGVRAGLLVCFDVEFPESVRALARAGCEVVLVPTALAARWQHLTRMLIPARAFENGLFVVYANYAGREDDLDYCGNSLVAGPDGFERARGGGDAEVVFADIDPADNRAARAMLPYLDKLDAANIAEPAAAVPSADRGLRR